MNGREALEALERATRDLGERSPAGGYPTMLTVPMLLDAIRAALKKAGPAKAEDRTGRRFHVVGDKDWCYWTSKGELAWFPGQPEYINVAGCQRGVGMWNGTTWVREPAAVPGACKHGKAAWQRCLDCEASAPAAVPEAQTYENEYQQLRAWRDWGREHAVPALKHAHCSLLHPENICVITEALAAMPKDEP